MRSTERDIWANPKLWRRNSGNVSVAFGVVGKKEGAQESVPLPFESVRLQRLPPNPVCCMALREMSLVEETPCIRNLKSSALEAFSKAVS